MKREADKIAEKLAKFEAKLESVDQQVPMDPIRGAPLKGELRAQYKLGSNERA